MIVLIIVLYIVFKIGLAKVFQKAGKKWFWAFIPIADLWVWIELSDSSVAVIFGPVFLVWLYSCIISFPFLGIFLIILALFIGVMLLGHWFKIHFIIARKFGGGTLLGLGLIFLPFIVIPILGFSSQPFVSSLQ